MKRKISLVLILVFLLTLLPNTVFAAQKDDLIKGQLIKKEIYYDKNGYKTVVEHYYRGSKSFYSVEADGNISILSVDAIVRTTVGDTDLLCKVRYFRQQMGIETFTTVGTVEYWCERLSGAKEIVSEMWTENHVLGTAYYPDGTTGSFFDDYESLPHKSITWVT